MLQRVNSLSLPLILLWKCYIYMIFEVVGREQALCLICWIYGLPLEFGDVKGNKVSNSGSVNPGLDLGDGCK